MYKKQNPAFNRVGTVLTAKPLQKIKECSSSCHVMSTPADMARHRHRTFQPFLVMQKLVA